MTIRDVSAIIATWVAILGGIVGGVVAIGEYQKQGREAQKERLEAQRENQLRIDDSKLQTFEMYRDFRSSDMLNRRAKFDEMGSDDPRLDFWINYFDIVWACVDSHLCDEELVSQLFWPYAIASLDEVQCRIVDVRNIERSYNLPKPQGYGLLRVANVDGPQCDPATRTTAQQQRRRQPANPSAVQFSESDAPGLVIAEQDPESNALQQRPPPRGAVRGSDQR
jgi:hypothetical protein